jgi:hypothetical protein
MRKRNDIFDRLAQAARARSLVGHGGRAVLDAWDRMLGHDPSRQRLGAPGTLERMADDLRMPVELLIEQFSRAGLIGLTGNDLVGKAAKDQLLAYLRRSHGMDAVASHVLYQNPKPTAGQIEVVQDANEELIRVLAANPSLMYGLNPRKFEELVALLFEKRGFDVTLTPPSKDGGFDFFAKLSNPVTPFLIVGECKRYSPGRKVGVEVVRGLHSVTETQGAHQGLVITSSFFTAGAVEYQRVLGSKMGLKDYDDLVGWLKETPSLMR